MIVCVGSPRGVSVADRTTCFDVVAGRSAVGWLRLGAALRSGPAQPAGGSERWDDEVCHSAASERRRMAGLNRGLRLVAFEPAGCPRTRVVSDGGPATSMKVTARAVAVDRSTPLNRSKNCSTNAASALLMIADLGNRSVRNSHRARRARRVHSARGGRSCWSWASVSTVAPLHRSPAAQRVVSTPRIEVQCVRIGQVE